MFISRCLSYVLNFIREACSLGVSGLPLSHFDPGSSSSSDDSSDSVCSLSVSLLLFELTATEPSPTFPPPPSCQSIALKNDMPSSMSRSRGLSPIEVGRIPVAGGIVEVEVKFDCGMTRLLCFLEGLEGAWLDVQEFALLVKGWYTPLKRSMKSEVMPGSAHDLHSSAAAERMDKSCDSILTRQITYRTKLQRTPQVGFQHYASTARLNRCDRSCDQEQ